MYLTLKQIKQQLNIDADYKEDDILLLDYATVAETIVQAHLDRDLSDLLDKDGLLPAPILQAMLLFIGNLYANREPVAFASATELPLSYKYLLQYYNKHGVG